MAKPDDKSTMRFLGEFFGHVIKGVKTTPVAKSPVPARTKVEEEIRETPAGRVVLRRTIIEEVVLPDPNAAPPADSPGPQQR